MSEPEIRVTCPTEPEDWQAEVLAAAREYRAARWEVIRIGVEGCGFNQLSDASNRVEQANLRMSNVIGLGLNRWGLASEEPKPAPNGYERRARRRDAVARPSGDIDDDTPPDEVPESTRPEPTCICGHARDTHKSPYRFPGKSDRLHCCTEACDCEQFIVAVEIVDDEPPAASMPPIHDPETLNRGDGERAGGNPFDSNRPIGGYCLCGHRWGAHTTHPGFPCGERVGAEQCLCAKFEQIPGAHA